MSLWAVTAVQSILCRRGRHHFIEVEPGYAYCVCGKTITPKFPPPRPVSEYLTDEDYAVMAMDDCKHLNPSFDRSICACGSMHYYCEDCGAQVDDCDDAADTTEAG